MARLPPRLTLQPLLLLLLLLPLLASAQTTTLTLGTTDIPAQALVSQNVVYNSPGPAASYILGANTNSAVLFTLSSGSALTLANLTLSPPTGASAVVVNDNSMLVLENVILAAGGSATNAVFKFNGNACTVEITQLELLVRTGFATFQLAGTTTFSATGVTTTTGSSEPFIVASNHAGSTISIANSVFTGASVSSSNAVAFLASNVTASSLTFTSTAFTSNTGILVSWFDTSTSVAPAPSTLTFTSCNITSHQLTGSTGSVISASEQGLAITFTNTNVQNCQLLASTSAYFLQLSNVPQTSLSISGGTISGNTLTSSFYFLTTSASLSYASIVNVSISGITFSSNTVSGSSAFGIYMYGKTGTIYGSVSITGSTFTSNTAKAGGLFQANGGGNVVLSTFYFGDNQVSGSTGTDPSSSFSNSVASGLAFFFTSVATLTITGSSFSNLNGPYAGLLALSDCTISSLYISQTTASDISSTTKGNYGVPGILVYDTNVNSAVIDQCSFTNFASASSSAFMEINAANNYPSFTVSNTDFNSMTGVFGVIELFNAVGGNFFFTNVTSILSTGDELGGFLDIDESTVNVTISNSYFANSTSGTFNGGVISTSCSNPGSCTASQGSNLYVQNTVFAYNTVVGGNGGVIYTYKPSNVYVTNCTFTGNSANNGGCIWVNFGASLYLANSTFIDNSAATSGGAVYMSSGGTAGGVFQVAGTNTFIGNTALGSGGALFMTTYLNPITISGFVLEGNSAPTGGGIAIDGSTTSVTLSNIMGTGNTASQQGGAIYLTDITQPISISTLTLTNNNAAAGAGLFLNEMSGSTLAISGVTATGNTATQPGGAISLSGIASSISITGVTALSNSAPSGGFISITDATGPTIAFSTVNVTSNTATVLGGGISLSSSMSAISLTGVTATSNTAATGGAISISSCAGSTVVLSSVTATGNTGSTQGGAIEVDTVDSVSLTDSSFTSNISPAGSALSFSLLQDLTLTTVTFAQNGDSSAQTQGTVFVDAVSSSVILSGLTFTADADVAYFTGTCGTLQGSDWTVSGTNNQYTGPSGYGTSLVTFYSFQGAFQLSDSSFSGNVAPLGALISTSTSSGSLAVSGTTFTSNNAQLVLAAGNTAASISDCTFSGNSLSTSEASLELFSVSQTASASVSSCSFSSNTAATFWSHSSTGGSTFTASNFTTNSATLALFSATAGTMTLTGATIAQPTSTQKGGCFSITNGAVSVSSSTLSHCTSSEFAGVAAVTGAGSFNLNSVTVTDSLVSVGSGIQYSGQSSGEIVSSTFSNFNTGMVYASGPSVTVTISDSTFSSAQSTSLQAIFLDVEDSAIASVTSSTFSTGSSVANPCVVVDSASLTMTGGSISNCVTELSGSALSVTGSSVVSVDDVSFTLNTGSTGGALSFQSLVGADITFSGCTFSNNSATTNGGVLTATIDTSNSVSFLDSTFEYNSASKLGGVMTSTDYAVMSFTGCTFTSNTAATAAIGYLDWSSVLTFTSCSITGSTGPQGGGSFYLDKTASLTLASTNVSHSTALQGSGGAVYLASASSLAISGCQFSDNEALTDGGAIAVQDGNTCTVSITNSIFTSNQAANGGAVYFAPSTATSFALTAAIFAYNTADYGGALYIGSAQYLPSLTSVTFTSNAATIFAPTVYTPPEALSPQVSGESLAIYSGGVLPPITVDLHNELGALYTLTPSPVLYVYLTLNPSAALPTLTGSLSGTFKNGSVTFSGITVIGNSGQYQVMIAPSASDTFYPQAKYAVYVNFTLLPCTGNRYQSLDLTCDVISCTGCPADIGAVCVSPGNCSCPAGYEGLQCDIIADAYDSVYLTFTTVPPVPGYPTATGINVESRDFILQELSTLYNNSVEVVYCNFFQQNGEYVFKYGLTTADGTYIEGQQLDTYGEEAQAFFAGAFPESGVNSTLHNVPVTILNPSDPLVISVIVISAILIAATVITMIILLLYRDTPVVRSASPLYCQMMLVGIILAYLTFIPYIGEPNRLSCMAPVVLGSLAFSIVFGNLLAKTYRIYRIFTNHKMRAVAPGNLHLLLFSGAIVVGEEVIVAGWLGSSPPAPFRDGPMDDRFAICYSDMDHTFFAILMAYNGVLLLIGLFLALKTRKAYSAFRETQLIGFTVYTIGVFTVAVLPVLFGLDLDVEVSFAIRSYAIIVCTTVTLALLFGSKVFIIMLRPAQNTTDYFNEGREISATAISKSGAQTSSGQKRMELGSSASIELGKLTNTKYVAEVSVQEDRPFAQWKKKSAVHTGDFFGFQSADGHYDSTGGLHPVRMWKAFPIPNEDRKIRVAIGEKVWLLEVASAETAKYLLDLLGAGGKDTSSASEKAGF